MVRFGGPEYSSGDKQSSAYLTCQITLLFKQQQLRDQLLDLEKEREQFILQEDFISTISHELLSPIGVIKGYTTTLLRADSNWNKEMQQEFLTVIDEETDRLEELIDNLLDSARLQSGSLSMDHQPVRLDTLLRDVVMRALSRQTNLTLKLDIKPDLPPILGDSRRLTQVFENIISNAIKYAPGCNLTIQARQQGKKIHIDFIDDGPGVSHRYLPSLFKKFYRNPESSTNTHGTGLGLFICKQIIQAHHGEIFAESELGKGLTIHVIIPLPETGKEKA
jgi:signal transduction histidine kinase